MCQLSNKFYAAVRTLSGDGPVKDRLAKAYGDNLDLIVDDEIPEAIRPRFELLRRQMHTAKPSGKEGRVMASVRKMSSTDASDCASMIVAMFSEFVRVKSTGERLKLFRAEPAPRSIGNGRDPASLN